MTNVSAEALIRLREYLLSPTKRSGPVRESVSYSRGQLTRSVEMTLYVEKQHGEAGTARDLLIPVLTPRKGRLILISDVSFQGSDAPARVASHSEHVEASKALLAFLILDTYSEWIKSDRSAVRRLTRVMKRLGELVEARPPRAEKLLRRLFREKKLRAYKIERRPPGERELFDLAKLLATRYLLLLSTTTTGTAVTFNYRYLTAYREARPTFLNRIALQLGGEPAFKRIPAPLARRTDDYFFQMEAPPGHYVLNQAAYEATEQPIVRRLWRVGRWRQEPGVVLRQLPFSNQLRTGSLEPSMDMAEGSLTEAHLYIKNATRSPRHIDVGIVTHEIPLGSAGVAWFAAFVTLFMTGLLLLFRTVTKVEGSDVPALLVAIVSTGAAASSLVVNRNSSETLSVAARLTLLSSTILGNSFAAWWLLASSDSLPRTDPLRWMGRLIQDYGGPIIVVLLALLFIATSWRARRVVVQYRGARSSHVQTSEM